ncbi:MAG: ABC transporter permease subunit [Actinomycetaceae bacterium]|nr:ABC transporter permease subunit [Actinomycetaceae bacterium]
MTTWTFTGYNMLIFLAVLQAFSHDLYEAARLDGALGWQITTSIKNSDGVFCSAVGRPAVNYWNRAAFNEPTIMASQKLWMGKDYAPMMMAYNTMMGALTPAGDGPASAISIVMALIAGGVAIIYALVQNKLQK